MNRSGKRLQMAILLEQLIRSKAENKRIAIVTSSGIIASCPSGIGNIGLNDCSFVMPQLVESIRVYHDKIETVYGAIMTSAQQIRNNNYNPEIIYTPNKNHLLKLGIDFSKEHFTFEMPSDNPAVESLRKSPIRK